MKTTLTGSSITWDLINVSLETYKNCVFTCVFKEIELRNDRTFIVLAQFLTVSNHHYANYLFTFKHILAKEIRTKHVFIA